MKLLSPPFFDELEDAQTILIAGAGGGFDIFSGLPLFFGLRAAGKRVHLANLSFSDIIGSTGRVLDPALVEVNSATTGSPTYFPELHLARWFEARGEDVPIFCFDRTGVRPLLQAYRVLVEHLKADTIILVDGGTDSLMRGDEAGLGTPVEDMASIAAVDQLDVARKFLVCLGFGIDAFHGVCHAQVLEAVANISSNGGYLGAWSLTREMPEVRLFREATRAVFRAMPHHPSIVSSSILAAIEGRFGDHHETGRTQGSTLFINPLMALYWCFRLQQVAERIFYLDDLKQTETQFDIRLAIEKFRGTHTPLKRWAELPM